MVCHSSDRPVRSHTCRGFTLIEVLVVLILFGMISSILFQALQQSYKLQDRFGTELFNVQQGQMAIDWYRQTVQSLTPDHPDGGHQFLGDPQKFSGLSSSPLSAEYGAPTPITWQVRNDPQNATVELIYIDGTHQTPILNWHSKAARFVYLDDKLEPHDNWPPLLGIHNQLPSQIQLQFSGDATATTLVTTPMGLLQPLPRQEDL
jgi:prepilin-type N-terminal cleavage/methylation domain-containing protein